MVGLYLARVVNDCSMDSMLFLSSVQKIIWAELFGCEFYVFTYLQ
jgi:hypothetical protein